MNPSPPEAWLAAELQADTSWIHRLSPEAAEGFQAALLHADASAKPLLDMVAEDFPLPPASLQALKDAFAATRTAYGLCLLKGLPVERWTVEQARRAYWGMSLHVGVGRTQNRASDILSHVRDEGLGYKVRNGRGYNTNQRLDFHTDSCDVVGLLCLHAARSGGESLVTSAIAMCDEIERVRPELIEAMREPCWYSYNGGEHPSQPPIYQCQLLGSQAVPFAFRTNRKNITLGQQLFAQAPRLSAAQIEALDLLDQLQPDPRYCYSMTLEQGDLQLLNNYVVVHSRTDFEDFAEPARKRHLLRLWLSLPDSQLLPPGWEEFFGDVRAGAVRGGLRGSNMSAQYVAYEARQARRLGMPLRPFVPHVVPHSSGVAAPSTGRDAAAVAP